MEEENKLKPSLGKQKGPTRFSRWTFWGWGIREEGWKPIYCDYCKERTYDSIILIIDGKSRSFCKDKDCKDKWEEESEKSKKNTEDVSSDSKNLE